MKSPRNRIALYLGGGGLLLAWLDPPEGLVQIAVILALIVIMAYLDVLLSKGAENPDRNQKVVSLRNFRSQQVKRGPLGESGREKRMQHEVFRSIYQDEVEAILRMLRRDGFHPMMVTQNPVGEAGAPLYRIMLPEKDQKRARGLIERYHLQAAKKPS